jgi:hypothetical protein
MPVFLKSEGPFSFYDHSLRYGHTKEEEQMTVTDKAALAALHRYEKDLLKLQQQRQNEKQTFFGNIELARQQAKATQEQNAHNRRTNQDYINQ